MPVICEIDLGLIPIALQIAVLDEQSKTAANKFNEEANRKSTLNNDEIYKKPNVDRVENMQVMLTIPISLTLHFASDCLNYASKQIRSMMFLGT